MIFCRTGTLAVCSPRFVFAVRGDSPHLHQWEQLHLRELWQDLVCSRTMPCSGIRLMVCHVTGPGAPLREVVIERLGIQTLVRHNGCSYNVMCRFPASTAIVHEHSCSGASRTVIETTWNGRNDSCGVLYSTYRVC